MKASELEAETGVHRLQIGRSRKRLFPNSTSDMTPEEVKAIKEDLGILTKRKRMTVQVLFAEDRFSGFVEAKHPDSGDLITIQVPHEIPPTNFIGKEIHVECRDVGDDRTLYQYNPWLD